MEKAIAAINAEMQKEPGNQYVEIIGQYLIDRCTAQTVADSINKGKTLSGAMEAVKSAVGKKGGQCVVMRDEEILDAVDTYLNIPKDASARQKCKAFVDGGSVSPSVGLLDLNFEDLI